MAGLRLSVITTEFVRIPVYPSNVGKPVDPSKGDDPKMAFVGLDATPEDAEWNDAEWERFTDQVVARCLVGPEDGVVLPVGEYAIWVKFAVDGETPVIRAGPLTVE